MSDQICPECGCHISVDAYEADGVTYCCKPCATKGKCECGCCEVVKPEEERKVG